MTDQELLRAYVDVWWQAINDFIDLLEELPEEEWSTPTDLPGWDVKAVASHIAHLEGILAGGARGDGRRRRAPARHGASWVSTPRSGS